MRSQEDAFQSWPRWDQLKSHIARNGELIDETYPSTKGIRSLLWKYATILDKETDENTWHKKLKSSRDAFDSLHKHFIPTTQQREEIDSFADPLSDNNNSPWESLRKDETIRSEIFQDVERCMPDNLYFQQPETQNLLLDILFIWARLNPDVGYRQGMHEVLAPLLWVIERDSIDPATVNDNRNTELPVSLIKCIFDYHYIGHDTFALFGHIMQGLKWSYEPGPESAVGVSKTKVRVTPHNETQIIMRSKRIIDRYLALTDPPLATHLQNLEVTPQLFIMRWVRLLFGREFTFDKVLDLWDRLFVKDASLSCVEYICVAMLLRIRWELVDADYNTAISLLLRYPQPTENQSAATLVNDALYLKANLNFDGGSELITRYTKRPPPRENRPITPPAESKSLKQAEMPGSARSTSSSRSKHQRNASALENIFQDAARGAYQRTEKWGLNNAVRDAVGEMRKSVQNLQSSRPMTPRTTIHSRNGSTLGANTPPLSTFSNVELQHKLEELLSRNELLAKMLGDAVEELWKQQDKEQSGRINRADEDNALAIATARVQFVQVYLQDSSLALPTEELSSSNAPAAPTATRQAETDTKTGQLENITATDGADDPLSAPINAEPLEANPQTPPKPFDTPKSTPNNKPSSKLPPSADRPSLSHSAFSWMLDSGDTSERTTRRQFISASPFRTEPEHRPRNSNSAFLFGDSEGDQESSPLGKSAKGKENNKATGKGDLFGEREDDDEGFKMGTLRGGPRKI